MAIKESKKAILAVFELSSTSLSLPELRVQIDHVVPERTLRRWLSVWVDAGILQKSGNRRSTRYQLIQTVVEPTLQFLQGLSPSKKRH